MKSLRETAKLIGREERWRWVVVAILAVIGALVETLGAVLIYLAAGRITAGPGTTLSLPLVGDPARFFPGASPIEVLRILAFTMAVFFVLRAGFIIGSEYVQERTAQRTGVIVSTKLFEGYLRMPYLFHVGRSSSDLMRTTTNSVDDVVNQYLSPMVDVIAQGLIVAFLFGLLVATNPLATLSVLAVLIPLSYALLRLVRSKLLELGTRTDQAYRGSLSAVQQSLRGIRDLKVLGREGFFEKRFRAHRSEIASARSGRAVLTATPRVGIETTVFLLVVVFLLYSAGRTGPATVSMLGLFAYAALRIMPGVNKMVFALNRMRFSKGTLSPIIEDLDVLDAAHLQATPLVDPLPFRSEITVEEVAFRYTPDSPLVLHDFNLAIRRGESFGIVGATGAGKSTLIDLILGLLEPTQGRLTVDGEDLPEVRAAWQRSIGLVPQTIFVLDDTIRRNVALGISDEEIDEEAVEKALRQAQLAEFVHSLEDGLETLVGEQGVRLSGGQRQRLAIARALYDEPSVLVFDEGTASLDNLTEAELIRSIESLRGERTIIMVAHRLSTVRRCDRIAFLEDGALVDVGAFDDLLARNTKFGELARASAG